MPNPSMADLRFVADLLATLPDARARRFASRLRLYDAGAEAGLTLEQAMGVARAPGKRCHWNAEKKERRDNALRAIYRQSFLDLGITRGAREMIPHLKRYKTSGSRSVRLSGLPKDVLDAAVEAWDEAEKIPQPRRMLDILRSE